MEFKGRALYNRIAVEIEEGSSPPSIEDWQKEDYRKLSEEELFRRLRTLGVVLDRKGFLLYAEHTSGPEELCDCLWIEDDAPQEEEQAYLLLFELWRRLLPGKQSLSVFCDEIDHTVRAFDKGEPIDSDRLVHRLSELVDILEHNTPKGSDPKKTFADLTGYLAHDLESFLFDFILFLRDEGNETAAHSLTEAFAEFVTEKKWFSLLRAYLLPNCLPEEKIGAAYRIWEEEKEGSDNTFLTEFLYFLKESEISDLFFACLQRALTLAKTEEEREELAAYAKEFSLEMPEKAGSIC